ncbi:Gluconokinase [Pleurostoma richardsiae]|uniref:Gluconokinase n=1 Tax=Pleurostoma richardsiae TaxID=41990 RepID=A0AA38RSH2_9PEZI|nr:Gluconokinase [Pleurostoma richardsiae]
MGKSEEVQSRERYRYIIFVTGPTACGKTTVAKVVADDLGLTYLEGDDFHPKANVEKMHHGEPLTDTDRWDWLHALRDHETMHPSDQKSQHLVITCSALKREYRDVLREGGEKTPDLRVRFLYLDAPEAVLRERAAERKGHFAGADLVRSQFEALERPAEDEVDVVLLDVNRAEQEARRDAVDCVKHILSESDK